MTDLEKEVKRISGLVQNKKLDKSAIERKAQLNLWKKHVDLESRFSRDEDKCLASQIFNTYISNYLIESFTDIQNLVDLVYEEVMQQKIQIDVDKILSDKNNKFVPAKELDSLHAMQDRIWSLKEKIGIVQNDKKDDLTALQELEKKFNTYIHFNRNEFTLYAPYRCSGCGKEDVEPLLLRKRVKNFEALKHPFFSGRFWYNQRGIQLVKEGVWSKEQYAFVFFTSVSYVDWVLKHENKIIELDQIKKEEIDEFISTNPFLKGAITPSNILKESKEDK
ncbi:MAG: hypothetical protein ACTSWD_02455 [Candidatus Heimdallarchaeota archaeon]